MSDARDAIRHVRAKVGKGVPLLGVGFSFGGCLMTAIAGSVPQEEHGLCGMVRALRFLQTRPVLFLIYLFLEVVSCDFDGAVDTHRCCCHCWVTLAVDSRARGRLPLVGLCFAVFMHSVVWGFRVII